MAIAVALLAWVGLVAAGRAIGLDLYEADYLVRIGAPPVVGILEPHLDPGIALGVVLGAAGIAGAPVVAAQASWRALLGVAWLAALIWPAALAIAPGIEMLAEPLTSRYEYLAAVGEVGSPGAFLESFTTVLPEYPTHVKGHPPLLVLVFWVLEQVGLGGRWPATALILAIAALTAPAALLAVRSLADEARARAAAPFLALAPAAVWIATSADALFMGVMASGIALFALASAREDRRGDALAAGAGLVLGIALFLSYGLAPLGAVVVAIAIVRRRVRPVLIAAGGVAAVFLAFALAGFWWLDGLDATRVLYEGGVSKRRPYAAFLVINLAAFALALGPATFAGIARLRDRRLWVLVGAGLVAVAAAEFSGLSRGETERIWLPFTPWLLVATAALARDGRAPRIWIALQVVVAITLQTLLVTAW